MSITLPYRHMNCSKVYLGQEKVKVYNVGEVHKVELIVGHANISAANGTLAAKRAEVHKDYYHEITLGVPLSCSSLL
jgi:hypothetical protein